MFVPTLNISFGLKMILNYNCQITSNNVTELLTYVSLSLKPIFDRNFWFRKIFFSETGVLISIKYIYESEMTCYPGDIFTFWKCRKF